MPQPSSERWSDFGIRLASAAILAPIALFCIWQGGLAWTLFIIAAAAGLALEWARLVALPYKEFGAWLILFGIIYPLGLLHSDLFFSFALLSLIAVFAGFNYGWFAAAGIPYAGIGAIALLWLRLQPHHGLFDTLFLVAVIWSTDIGAYLVGRILGGAKLAPYISPGKTRSGAIGGLVSGSLAGLAMTNLNLWALPVALLLSIFAQTGDLLESAIKRKLGVKDSGNTIPGHGGLFDRLDGFLIAAPLAALLAACGGFAIWR